MPSLRKYPWEVSYATSDLREDGRPVDILDDFYLPVLERSTHYDRVAGYFSSTSLAIASRGFSRFVAQNGRARFIVGADVSAEDAEAILEGDLHRAGRCLNEALGEEMSWPEEVTRGVELLAWMVAHGYLQVKVGIRVHTSEGRPVPLDYRGDGYVHEKWAIFSDGEHSLVASGSLNESRTALVLNAENLDIHPDWNPWGAEYVRKKQHNFETLWSGTHPGIRTFELPEAVKNRLLRISRRLARLVEIDGTLPPTAVREPDAPAKAPTPLDRARFAFLRLAPLLPGGEYVGMETAPVTPWPHQRFVARRLIDAYPDNHLLCDEVGLGKTIEAGLVFRSLWLAGTAHSIRVFAPASLTRQWLQEMAGKFLLPFRRRKSRHGHYETADPHTGQLENGLSPVFDYPLEIISTGLLVHGRGNSFLDAMDSTDIVLVDEAHKARRRDPDQTQREPRFNNLYHALEGSLFPKARSLQLATATPMQLNQVEAFDLLRFMHAAGAVRLSPELSDTFYRLRDALLAEEEPADHELDWLVDYLRDARDTAPTQWAFVAAHVLGAGGNVALDNLLDLRMPPALWEDLHQGLTMLSPLGRPMLRHTRQLLRAYQRGGLLDANLARRNVQPVIVALHGQERALYEQLQGYCEALANRIAANMDDGRQRAAIGFYLSFLRLRFASSFVALRRSLERRLEKIQRTLDHHAEQTGEVSDHDDPEELTEEELTGLVLRNRKTADLTWELGAVEELLGAVRGYTDTPRKTRELIELIERRHERATGRVKQLVVFTRYTETLDYLYEELRRRLPRCPLATFSGGGGTLRGGSSSAVESLNRNAVRQRFVRGEIDILLCTDAAAEGLNLQSADLLVNFDLPWNPMLLEQRIGRIDRIGQVHPRIHVTNFAYQGSVEEHVYVRLVQRFQQAASIAGELQFSLLPIEEQDFQDYAKAPTEPGKIGWDELIERANTHRKRILQRQQLTEFPAEEQKRAYQTLERENAAHPPPVSLETIWQILSESETLKARGCRVETYAHGDALRLNGIPRLDDGLLLTASRALYENGIAAETDTALHFATYGEPVFEALLDWMLEDEEAVNRASQQRQPITAIRIAEGIQVSHFRDVPSRWDRKGEAGDITPVPAPHAGALQTPENRGLSGLLNRQLLLCTAAEVARTKLRDKPDRPAEHLARLDSFRRDLEARASPHFQMAVALPNQSAFLAHGTLLLWPVEPAGQNVRVTGDPLLLGLCRTLIEQAMAGLQSERRTGPAIADRLSRQAQASA